MSRTTEPRWYCVNTIGMATLCRDEADARREAADADTVWPRHAPHVATQLVPMAELDRLRARVAELEHDARRYRWLRSIDAKASVHWYDDSTGDGLINGLLDSAIDAAMAKDGACEVQPANTSATSRARNEMSDEFPNDPVEHPIVGRWPNSKITVSAILVSTEITEEDEGDPRMIEVKLSRESPGLIVLQGITRSDQSIAFFVEQWAALRRAIDTIAALSETNANLMDET